MNKTLSKSERVNVLTHLIMAEEFEQFLHKKFGNYKRYSGEGSEALIPALHSIIGSASKI